MHVLLALVVAIVVIKQITTSTNSAVNMAWRCSGSSNEELVHNLYKANIIKSTSVKNAMLKVDRKHYLPDNSSNSAYDDMPLPIGHRVTIRYFKVLLLN
jgi:protein-L-isoaspartate(D-aspartate) O-methyltransferase